MKNLAQLKLNANRFKWSMISNSWFNEVPDFLATFRPVSRVQTNRIAFTTVKDGIVRESWTDFPKASNLEMVALDNADYRVTFKGESEKDCTLSYLLRPIEG